MFFFQTSYVVEVGLELNCIPASVLANPTYLGFPPILFKKDPYPFSFKEADLFL
jgi:hypothetical protein